MVSICERVGCGIACDEGKEMQNAYAKVHLGSDHVAGVAVSGTLTMLLKNRRRRQS